MIDLPVQSEQKEQILNITDEVRKTVGDFKIPHGLAIVSIPHTTASLFLSEDDSELREDLLNAARGLLSHARPFTHHRNNNPNAEAHIMSSLFGSRIVIPVVDNELKLGPYQNIFFLELDGPKRRSVEIFLYPPPSDSPEP